MAGRQTAGATTKFVLRAIGIAGGPSAIAAIGAYTTCINLLALTGPAYMLVLYGRVVPTGSSEELATATAVMVALYLAGAAAEIARQDLVRKIAKRLERALTARAQEVAPIAAHDFSTIRSFLLGPAPTAFCDVPFVPLYVACLLLLHPMFCALAVVGTACLAALMSVPQRHGSNGSFSRWLPLDAVRRAFRPILQSMTLGLGAYLVMNGRCHAGSAFAAAIVLQRMLSPVEALLTHLPSARAALASARRLLDAPSSCATPAPANRGEIRIVLRRSRDYARSATRGGATSASSDLRPTAQ